MKMKKLIVLTLAVLMVLGLFAGCQPADNSGKPVLKVAVSPDFAPMEFVDPTKTGQDKFVGFDISLAKFIAEELGMTLEIVPLDFDACQAAVATGKVDMSISGYSWTADREDKYNLSDYYYAGENETVQVLITLKKNAGKYTTADSLKGVKVGAQGASLQEGLVKAQLPNSTLVPFTDINTGLQQLKKGDFEVMAVAIGNANALINNNPDIIMSGFQFVVDEKEANNLILLQKGADELTAKVNAALAKAKAAGYYDTWYEEALNTAGVDQSYDADGNPIVK
jgi:polar amino acid transport system substrate-binding protein